MDDFVPDGFRVLTIAALLNQPQYTVMDESERKANGWPDSPQARKEFIQQSIKARPPL